MLLLKMVLNFNIIIILINDWVPIQFNRPTVLKLEPTEN